jgi:cation transport ATPase
VPVDGTVMSSEAVIDTSTLGGEPLPQTASRGMADRYAGFFLPATVLVAPRLVLSFDSVRALAVVVATPCPLILAAPIALVSGLSPRERA